MTGSDEVRYLKASALEKQGKREEADVVYASIPTPACPIMAASQPSVRVAAGDMWLVRNCFQYRLSRRFQRR
jgi:hypothetical protein